MRLRKPAACFLQAQRQRRGSSSRLDEDEDIGVREGQERRRSQAQHLTDEEVQHFPTV